MSSTPLERMAASFSALLLAFSFEESTILFALVLMEAMGFPSEILRLNWKWSLYGVVGLAVCFIRECRFRYLTTE